MDAYSPEKSSLLMKTSTSRMPIPVSQLSTYKKSVCTTSTIYMGDGYPVIDNELEQVVI